jgi:large conductance mechanosensitive channel
VRYPPSPGFGEAKHGGYGVTVNTGACGALNPSSILGSRPMKNFFKEFETFALRGNAIDLAVGVVFGAAFNQVTTAFANNVLTPPIGLLINNVNFSELVIHLGGTATIAYGIFLQAVLNFIIIAFALFIIVKAVNRVKRQYQREEKKEAGKPKPIEDEELKVLREIRDALKNTRSAES